MNGIYTQQYNEKNIYIQQLAFKTIIIFFFYSESLGKNQPWSTSTQSIWILSKSADVGPFQKCTGNICQSVTYIPHI